MKYCTLYKDDFCQINSVADRFLHEIFYNNDERERFLSATPVFVYG